MRILYIAEDLFNSSVHENLCNELNKYPDCFITGYKLDRYSRNVKDICIPSGFDCINYILPNKYKKRYKCDFTFKAKIKFSWLEENTDLSKYDVVHASTLFSDGIIAYKIFEKYRIPYVIGIRNTDIDLYCKYFFHLWRIGKKIIENASQIVFITPNLYDKFVKSNFNRFTGRINLPHYSIIPNGIDQIWLNNITINAQPDSHKIIFIGKFDSNKNVENLIKAAEILKHKYTDLHLTLIGGNGNKHKNILNLISKNYDICSYRGEINDKKLLLKEIRQHSIFAMVSHSETFGLVYIEALSQGLRILYSKGQGIDNLFKEKLGESAYSYSLEDIVNKLDNLLSSHDKYEIPTTKLNQFSWNSIAQRYKHLYDTILGYTTKNYLN